MFVNSFFHFYGECIFSCITVQNTPVPDGSKGGHLMQNNNRENNQNNRNQNERNTQNERHTQQSQNERNQEENRK